MFTKGGTVFCVKLYMFEMFGNCENYVFSASRVIVKGYKVKEQLQSGKIKDVTTENVGIVYTVVLKGFWTETALSVGDIIHVFGFFNDRNCCNVTDMQNFVITNPDLLVTGTAISSAVFCRRKSVSFSINGIIMFILLYTVFRLRLP